jgi:amino acid adenylation domain-containing protein
MGMSEEISIGIAIIGVGARLPGAKNADEFWRNLCAELESITHFTVDELEDSFDAETRAAPNFVKARPILENIDQFDAEFFGMYAKEAELTDPQHRVLLECAWEALENAGYDPAQYSGAIGVYAGSSINTYFIKHVLRDRKAVDTFTSDYQVGSYPALLGAGHDFTASRIAYKLNLRGPAINLNSACSTSMLTVAQACQSLLMYQSDMALAGGVSISLPQRRGYLYQEGGMASSDGHCRSFDAAASGTVFGSGAGMVLLKRLEDALADGDHIYAVIRGCGVNNDGAAKVGFTAPSVEGQAACIEMAHALSGVDPRTISYVECHGTATPLGDPIEVAGLTQAFRASTADTQFCLLGSAKSNVGHLDAAAGVTGLIKTAYALKHHLLPATLHYKNPNPQIDFSVTPFSVNAELRNWHSDGPRRAGVSAFGVGGTNVHAVLEETPAEGIAPLGDPELAAGPQLLLLSARNAAALDAAKRNLAQHLRENPSQPLADIAYTLQVGRRAFDQRSVIVAESREQAIAKLAGDNGAQVHSGAKASSASGVVFMFPGQGAQYPDMGRGLYAREPVFRDAVDRCAQILLPLLNLDLRKLLYPNEDADAAAKTLMSTISAQPAIFTVEYALAQLWLSWGVRPTAMIGHSIGEFVAATLAGVFALEDALALVAARGRLMQALPGGAMLAVRLPERDVLPLLNDALSIAAINGPALCVVSGPYDAIDALEKLLAERSAVSRRLHTSHAFHSAMVDPIIEPLRAQIASIKLSPPSLPYVSCVSGTWISEALACSPDYWARHAREPVRFADGITALTADQAPLLLEVGPGTVLTTLALQITRGRGLTVCGSLPDAARETSDAATVLESLGRLWIGGLSPDWLALHGGIRRRVPLPTYPFQRSRHWIDAPASESAPAPRAQAERTFAPNSATLTAPTPSTAAPQPANLPSGPTPVTQDEHAASLRNTIIAILEDLSGEQPPTDSPNATFLEMGFDSLFLTQVTQRIQSQLKVKITFRQLLGEYSTIPSLAAFLAEKTPRPAAAAVPSAVSVATVPAAATAMPSSAAVPLAPGAASGIEGLFRDQLAAMSQLISQQMAALQGLGVATNTGPTAAPAPAAASMTAAAPAAVKADDAEAEFQRPSRFQVYKPGAKTVDSAISPEQTAHIEALVTRYAMKMSGSKKMSQDYRAVLADPRAAAGFRAEWKEMVFPIVCAKSKGSKIWDVDGNEYIDLVNGYGQTAFGHTPDFVADAVKAQLDQGFAIGPQADLAGKVAALFAELTGNERVTFCNTGSEAVMAAMRVARNITGRMKVVVFNGAYHGQFDEVLVKGVQRPGAKPRSKPVANGIPDESVANMVVLDYGTPESLQWVRDNADDLAAVVVETVQSRHPNLYPLEFLRELRKITEASGTAFVMDEVVTGFRVHPGGMQHVTGIRADMATYGKVVGGGLPIGILAGKRAFMDGLDGGFWQYGDESFPEVGVTFFAGTFVRHPLVLAAVDAVLQHIKTEGPQLQENLAKRTTALVAELNAVFQAHGLTTRIESFSSWFYFNFHNEHPLSTLFFYHLRERGIHIQDGFPCFLTTAHSDSDLRRIVTAFRESLADLQTVGILAPAAPTSPTAAASSSAGAVASTTGAIIGLPLTEPQVEIWLAAQRGDEASCAFNESVTLRLNGTLNTSALQNALDGVVARHDALRASFGETGEAMNIAAATSLPIAQREATDEAVLAALLNEDARTPFDLSNGPLLRAQLVRLGAERHALVITAHHIICDGWSINVIVNELAEIYAALCRGEAPDLQAPLPFSRYALAQKKQDAAEAAKTEAFWLAQYADPVTPLDLPTDRPRAAYRSYNGASRCHRINADIYLAVKKSGAKLGSTLFATLLAAFEALAGRLGNLNEIVVAVPTAGQSLLEDEILVGHCVNFLPIRNRWTEQTRVAEHLANVAKSVLDAFEHQRYTFGTLVRKLAPKREMNRLPLTEIQFNLERLADRLQLPGLTVDVEPNAKAFVNFDLFLNIIESTDGLRMDCDYNTDLYDAETIDRWLDCYQALLEAFVADPAQALVRANCIPAPLREQLVNGYNESQRAYPSNRCIHQLFEAQAAAHPDKIAAQFGDASLTYSALDRRANQIANLLYQRTVGVNKPVGILIERSLDMLAALLAVMKVGRAYIPLDPTHPAARLKHILGEADIGALITDDVEALKLVRENVASIHFAHDAIALASAATTAPAVTVDAEQAAYLIYTSGSTGLPKGVEVSHRAVVNLLLAMAHEPGLSARDILFAVTTISFDIAALELYLPLAVGGSVVIAETEEMADGFRLAQHIQSTGATVMQATPATWRILLEAEFKPAPGFKMLCGGEALPRELANRMLAQGGELWNMYGPTETTIWSSCTRVTAGDAVISIGKPIANTQFYILDKQDQLLPPGVPGQLHIGGDGVAIGYYKRPELNTDRFIANPFGAGRIYRSGDLARWLPDGTVQHLGRMDHQTKLRGFRIELGEIEASLVEVGEVATAAVVLREDTPGAPKLAAYYVEKAGISRTPAQLRAALAERLPDYMIPSAWLKLDAFPLTPNGKLDRAALPAPIAGQVVEAEFIAPASPMELTLAKIWAEVLHLKQVGTTDDLFVLGADSIQIFQIAARANRENIRLTAKQMIQQRTIGALAKALESVSADEAGAASGQPALPSLKQFQRKR